MNLFDNEPAAFRALPLSQFVDAIGRSIRSNPETRSVWITAELSDVRGSGGHCYMELIEKDSRGATVAKIRANIWAGTYAQLRAKFLAATGRDIVSGLKVMVLGTATHHNLYGLSVNITDIDPSYTLGDMERLRREILMKLQREGILNLNKSQYLPPDAQRIAVISAPGAAGFGDFMKQLDGNPQGFKFYTHLFPAVMQGERTSASVRAALDFVEQTIDIWDCVVIVRGGGATTDLNGFDDYALARRVAEFPLPVLIGIGHERDRTVLDEIAHTRLKTPTAVGAFLVDRLAQAWQAAETMTRSIADYAANRINGDMRAVGNMEAMIPVLANARMTDARMKLSRLASAIPAAAGTRIAASQAFLDSLPNLIRAAASNRTRIAAESLRRLAPQIDEAARARSLGAAQKLSSLSQIIEAYSPEATLARGYSVTRIGGKTVRSAQTIAPGEVLETTFADGTIFSRRL